MMELSRSLQCGLVPTTTDQVDVLVKLSDPRDSDAATNALVVAYRDLMLNRFRNVERTEIAEMGDQYRALRKEVEDLEKQIEAGVKTSSRSGVGRWLRAGGGRRAPRDRA